MQNTPRQERIAVLEKNIARKVEQNTFDSLVEVLHKHGVHPEFLEIKTMEELHAYFAEHMTSEYYQAFYEAMKEYRVREQEIESSASQKVLSNIANTRGRVARVSQIGRDIDSSPDYKEVCIARMEADPAYQVLSLLRNTIRGNQEISPESWERRDDTDEEMVILNFISAWKIAFLRRSGLSSWKLCGEIVGDLATEEQYNLLAQIRKTPEDVQNQILQEICTILPSCAAAKFYWSRIQEIVNKFSVIEQDTQTIPEREPRESALVYSKWVIKEVFWLPKK